MQRKALIFDNDLNEFFATRIWILNRKAMNGKMRPNEMFVVHP